MALSGLEIYKLTPKKNCRECGVATCMAFAMALANGKAKAEACPYLSDEAKAALGSAAEPPVRLVTVGSGERKVEAGDEHVLFRHEKTFYHPAAFAIVLADTLSAEEQTAKLARISALEFERVGIMMRVNMVAVEGLSNDPGLFRAASERAAATGLPLVLVSRDPGLLAAALESPVVRESKPLLYGVTPANLEATLPLAIGAGVPVALCGSLDEMAEMAEKAAAAGHRDLLLAPAAKNSGDLLRDLTQIRRLALRKKFRPLGYPTLVEARGENVFLAAATAGVGVAKYAGIILLDEAEHWLALPLVTQRQDIYTDPQKPIQVQAKCYEIGDVDDGSPVFVTTNFSLTYFSVLTEIEASRVPSYLVTVDTDGTSVLTAWAAGKFGAEEIKDALENNAVEGKVGHHKVIIPGYVAVLSGKLAAVSGWEVLVGPRESTGIPTFLRSRWKAEEEAASA